MKNQDIFPSEFFAEEFSKRIFQSKKFFREIWKDLQTQNKFVKPWLENAVENLKSGVRFFEEAQDTQGSFEEGGIRIQENRPKSGGREET